MDICSHPSWLKVKAGQKGHSFILYIYVLPSDLEGMPLSLLEAMSYGNCCLVSDIAECAEVVEDKAVLFRKGSEQYGSSRH